MIQRLVIRAPNWLGDAVMALAAMAAVRSAFAETTIAVAAPILISPMFEEQTIASPNEVLALNDNEADLLRAGRFDAVLLFPNSFRSAWTVRRAGIPERWGFSTNMRQWMLTRAIARPRGQLHQSKYYLELVRKLGHPAPERLPEVRVTLQTADRAAALLERLGVSPSARLVGFAPGAAYGHAKRWPPQRVAQVIMRLTRECQAVCMLVGTAGDRSAGREIESSLPPDVSLVNLIGRTDLRLLLGLLARCAAFVSNDSGAMHLAAALGVPVTAIFGPTDERATAPAGEHDILIHQVFCRPCMLRECPIDHRCMKGIGVDAVFASVARRLEARV